jgi:small subunit ribosomal protein S16
MPAKIRLSRHGKKGKPFYHIVIADNRAPRDGRFIERIGFYNPNTNPATIELKFDRALSWLQKGAQPTDTCRAILSYKGVLYKNHLLRGVKKGALTEEQADEKFTEWLESKTSKIQSKIDGLDEKAKAIDDKKLKAETKVRETRAQELAKKNSDLAEEVDNAEADAAENVEPAPETEPAT